MQKDAFSYFLGLFALRQSLQQHNGIGYHEHAQDHDPKHGLAGSGEGGQRIEHTVGNDARPQGAAAPENDNVQESNEHSEEYLHQIFRYTHAAAVEQIDDMSQTKGDAGDHHRPLDAVTGHGLEQESSENQFFQESDTEHLDDEAHGSRGIIVHFHAAPNILECNNNQRYVEQKGLCGDCRLAQAKALQFTLLLQPEIQKQTGCHSKHRRGRTLHTDTAGDLIENGHAHAVDADPHEGKAQFTFLIKLFHSCASFEKMKLVLTIGPINQMLSFFKIFR